MKIVDANVLLNATNQRAPDHEPARNWLNQALSGGSRVGFPWIVLLAFIRLATRPGIFPRALTADEAMAVVDAWLSSPSAVVVHPSSRHVGILADLLRSVGTAGNLTNDAHIAALAIEQRAQVVSFDADFDRFPGVRWERPGR